MRPDPTAWTRKYFTVASFSWLDCEEDNIGINEIKFNSKPTQRNNQLLDDNTITTPAIKVLVMNVEYGRIGNNINKQKELHLFK